MGLFETGRQRLLGSLLAGALSLSASGCAKRYVMIQTGIFPKPMLFEDALEWTREGADVVQTMHDFEAAEEAAYGSMGMLEGLHPPRVQRGAVPGPPPREAAAASDTDAIRDVVRQVLTEVLEKRPEVPAKRPAVPEKRRTRGAA